MPSPNLVHRLSIEQRLEHPSLLQRLFGPPVVLGTIRKALQLTLRITALRGRGQLNALRPVIRLVRLGLPTLPSSFSGMRVLHLSDLHADAPIPLVNGIIDAVRGLAVDLCVLTGDYRFEASGPCGPACEAMAQILAAVEAPLGVFGVLGNHDSASMVERLGHAGAAILVNTSAEIRRGRERIHIVGVDDPAYFGCDDLAMALAAVPGGEFKILLAHSPEAAIEAAHAGIDLYLCGHTHGGQICLPWIGAVWMNARCPRQFTRGLWRHANMLGITSAGAGVSLVPARFHCPPEITVIELLRDRAPSYY